MSDIPNCYEKQFRGEICKCHPENGGQTLNLGDSTYRHVILPHSCLFVQQLTLQILQMYAYSYKQLAANEYMTLDRCFTSILQTNYKN